MRADRGLPERWCVLADATAVAETARGEILAAARESIDRRGAFKLVLAGGSTPQAIYRALARETQDWARWRIYFGDERCLPPDDAERNSRMAAQAWLDHVAIPHGNLHPIPAERGPEAGARAYAEVVVPALPFDLVLLGLGEDGHTASLFPGHRHDEQEWVHAVRGAPKPPPERVSLSLRALASTRRCLFLVTGEGKRAAVAAWREGAGLPAARVAAAAGAEVLIDEAAAGGQRPSAGGQ
jgi:6-phosphogluconolactonase